MKYFSTNDSTLRASSREAVLAGLAPDGGLYMPLSIPKLKSSILASLSSMSLQEIAVEVAELFFAEDLSRNQIEQIVGDAINFPAPLHRLDENLYVLELFHGPTLAFKDFGARFMARLMAHFQESAENEITVLAATSGDTGSAVANGFYDIPGFKVVLLYPSGKVSEIQEKQFTTLGKNIHALEIFGTFDDCQKLVKAAFLDPELKREKRLASANSINIARLIPQTFYYCNTYARLHSESPVFSVPCGNFGNLTAGIIARRMGIPIAHFVASTNVNDVVPVYLKTGEFKAKPSSSTISNAMDVGNPSNFSRMQSLYEGSREDMASDVSGYSFTDEETKEGIKEIYSSYNYVMDPHGSVAYLGLKTWQKENLSGVILQTAHPAKFPETVESVLKNKIEIPESLKQALCKKKMSVSMVADFEALKDFLLSGI